MYRKGNGQLETWDERQKRLAHNMKMQFNRSFESSTLVWFILILDFRVKVGLTSIVFFIPLGHSFQYMINCMYMICHITTNHSSSPQCYLTNHISESHPEATSWHQHRSHYHSGTTERSFTAKKLFGHGDGHNYSFFLLKLLPLARLGTTCIYQLSYCKYQVHVLKKWFELQPTNGTVTWIEHIDAAE